MRQFIFFILCSIFLPSNEACLKCYQHMNDACSFDSVDQNKFPNMIVCMKEHLSNWKGGNNTSCKECKKQAKKLFPIANSIKSTIDQLDRITLSFDETLGYSTLIRNMCPTYEIFLELDSLFDQYNKLSLKNEIFQNMYKRWQKRVQLNKDIMEKILEKARELEIQFTYDAFKIGVNQCLSFNPKRRLSNIRGSSTSSGLSEYEKELLSYQVKNLESSEARMTFLCNHQFHFYHDDMIVLQFPIRPFETKQHYCKSINESSLQTQWKICRAQID